MFDSEIFLAVFYSLQIFSNDGQFRSRFGIRGRSPGQMQRPTGVAVHPSGDIIIADYDNKWVSIFSNEGKFKVSFLYFCLCSGISQIKHFNHHFYGSPYG